MSERRDKFKEWLVKGLGFSLKDYDINYVMNFVDELININDKLSSALDSAENRIEELLSILQGKEMNK